MAQDVQFGGNKDNVNKESETSLRLEGVNEDDVENRFNLGGFAGQVSFVSNIISIRASQ